jgi:signal peptidase I
MQPPPPLTDRIAELNPAWIVVVVAALTLARVALARPASSGRSAWARTASELCDTGSFVLILSFLLFRPFVAQANWIPSASMRQTLVEQDRLVVDKFSYRLSEPARGDVVVFNPPADATDERREGVNFIKRLVALPGDTVAVRGASLLVGGERFDGATARSYLRARLGLGEDDAVKFFPGHVLIGGTRRLDRADVARLLDRPGEPVTITPGATLRDGRPLDEPYTREDPDYDFGPLRLGSNQLFLLGDNRNNSRDSHYWGALERWRVVGRARFVFWPPSHAGRIP